jgi:hypothetical protein
MREAKKSEETAASRANAIRNAWLERAKEDQKQMELLDRLKGLLKEHTAALERCRIRCCRLSADVQRMVNNGAHMYTVTDPTVLAARLIQGVSIEALTGLQNVKIAGEFEKLAEKLKEAHAEATALGSGSPFAKIDADVLKLTRDWGLAPGRIGLARQALIELQATENAGKAFEAAGNLSAGGARMHELREQMDALRDLQARGVGLDGGKLDTAAIRLEMQAIAEEEDKILLKTGNISAGFHAWATDLQKVQSAGEMTFEMLSQATKGVEDTATKSLLAPLEAVRGRQENLIAQLRKMWASYFMSLAEMGIKQSLTQALAPVGKAITAGLGTKPPAAGAGVSAGKDALMSLTGAGKNASGAASLTSAGTMLHSAATALLSAATALRASAGGVGGGASEGGGLPDFMNLPPSAFGAIPMFAGGGDATPGSSFISGEAGAEEVDLDRSGGAHITPLGFSEKGGGDTHQYFDQRGAIITDDLMRRAEAAHMMKASEGRMMAAIPAMQREIALRKRS